MNYDEIIKIAKEIAINSNLVHKHGSVLFCDGKIFTGYNHFVDIISIDKMDKKSIAIHAEEDVINNFISYCRQKYFKDIAIRKKLKKSILFTIKYTKTHIGCSIPCENCIKIIKSYGIKKIIYSTYNTLTSSVTIIENKVKNVHNRPSKGFLWRSNKR